MNPMAKAIVRSGILDENALAEFVRWKAPSVVGGEEEPPIETADELVTVIERALQSKDLVVVRSTDLDIVRQFGKTQRLGRMIVQAETGQMAQFDVTFGISLLGDYIIPWLNEILEELLAEGSGHLVVDDREVHFSSVSALSFDEVKTFLLCKPSPV